MGWFSMISKVLRNDTVALFYDGFEAQANDMPFGRLMSDLRGQARKTYRTLRKKQIYTGYYTAFLNLKSSLESVGITVRVNDFAYARANPDQPIGISGFPAVFDKVILKNPAVFGPGLVPPPDKVEGVMRRCNIRVVTLPSEWPSTIWRPILGDAVQPMFVSIDVDNWPDLSHHLKTIDVLIYEKIHWGKDERRLDLVNPLLDHLKHLNLSYSVLKYGGHHLGQFRHALANARSLVFLSEHETQGLAYQEAMSSNVPIFAWNEGILADPHQKKMAPPNIVVSSVPYFDHRCGMTFKRGKVIETFDTFWVKLEEFSPRDYVQENLNFAAGAARYLSLLEKAVEDNSASD